MLSSISIQKIYTENPFIDSLLYFTKYLAYNSVVKLSRDADQAETTKSIKEGDLYIISYEGRGSFPLYEYDETDLSNAGVPKEDLRDYALHNSKIPDKYRDKLTAIGQKKFLDNYIENNNYYRKLMGLPNIGDYGIPIKNYEYLIPDGNEFDGTYIHDIGYKACRMLDSYGILDQIKADYPDASYLQYCTCGITAYKARKAFDYQVLYRPSTGIVEIDEKFDSKYALNRAFMIHSMYSEAFATESDYYDNFMGIMIMLMTMVDMISEVQDDILKRDILDARCIEFIFQQYGIPYYHSIPLMYQTRMVKQVNNLVRNKSCMQGMLNFIDLFGCGDIQVFKYYLLKDRKTDAWGNYLYNLATTITSVDNTTVLHQETKTTITNDTVPFPFSWFLQKGNVLFIFLDGHKLVENVDYEIYNYDKIRFLNNSNAGHSEIEYEFYYDKTTMTTDFIPDKDNGVNMVYEDIVATSNSLEFHAPYASYFIDGNQVIVVLDGHPLNPNFYTINDKTIDVIDNYVLKGRPITLIYIYGNKFVTYFKKVNSVAYVRGQTKFAIPEPFKNYTINGNQFFVTIGNTMIDPRRYTINLDGAIDFSDIKMLAGRAVTFNFLYSKHSIYTPVNIMHSVQTIVATDYFQCEFDLKFPIEQYLKFGYRVYVELRGWFLSDEYYDVYTNKLQFRDIAIGLHPGDVMKIHYIYGPTEENIVVGHDYRVAQSKYQDTYDISYPTENYFLKGNQLFIDSNGYIMEEGKDYYLSSDKSKVTITNKDILPFKGQRVNLTFMYNAESENSVKIKEQYMTAESDGQSVFYLNFPFYPYLETGQGFLLFHKSRLVPYDRITINQYNVTVEGMTVKKGDVLVALFVFNNKYLIDQTKLLTVKELTVPLNFNLPNPDLDIEVPVPFDDYIENDWPLFADSNKQLIDESKFEYLNNTMLFIKPTDVKQYSSMTFTFIYKNYAPYINTESTEDFSKDADLKFVRIPLDSKHPLEYLKNQKGVRTYDNVTLSDKFWDGDDNVDNVHEALKAQILKRPFNYARTKYMTIDYVVDLTEMAFQIPYFYNMLYDDVFKENLLTFEIPTISPNKKFKLADLFVYMTALAHNFSGITDKIMDSPTQAMWVKGFNFRSDLGALKQYILDNRRLWTDYDVFGFMEEETQIPDMKEFVKIYKTNKSVWKTIVHGMREAPNYDIYSIWKKMYDSLMVWKYNLEFFKLADGTIAPTYTEFLKEEDNVLYTSIISITSIDDKESRENQIVTVISDIVYILEQYLDSKEFKYIYNQFPGVSAEYLLQYLFTMINFFKSYKVILHEMNVDFTIGNDPDTSTIRFNDTKDTIVSLSKLDYMKSREVTKSLVTLHKDDKVGFNDNASFRYTFT